MTNKKTNNSNLLCGIGFAALGIILIIAGNTSDKSIITSLGFGFCGSAGGLLWKSWYWSRPGRDYEQHLHREKIKSQDEMLVMLRRQAGWLANVITLIALTAISLFFAFCVSFNWLLPFARYGLYLAGGLLIFVWLCGVAAFYWLREKY